MQISLREIKQSYAVLKGMARERLDIGDINGSLSYINNCAVLAQQFNWIYADDDLERMEKEIGEQLIPQTPNGYEANENRVVVFDDFCVTFILTLQYIEALVKSGKEVLLLTARPIRKEANNIFFDYLAKLEGVQIKQIIEQHEIQCIPQIYEAILEYRPAKIFLQLNGMSSIIPVLHRLPKSIKSYLINQADQMFWLGARAIDYCIEFRPFGPAVSLEKRGLKREQLLMLPFYPIHDKNPFEGFPKGVNGHVTIFSGGDVYKTLDSKRAYWKLIKRILDTYPDVRFLFATKVNPFGSQFIEQFVKDNHFEGRFIEVGFRKDIYECLKHCDIYMGTCPTSGSLMSQLAAINGTPILQYYYPGTPDDETEQALCINDKFQISFQDMDAFMQEADKLINDAAYRKKQGERIQNSMIQPEQFDEALVSLLETNKSPFPVETVPVNYELIDNRWYESQRYAMTQTLGYIYSLLGKNRCLRYVPTLYVKKQLLTIKNKLHL